MAIPAPDHMITAPQAQYTDVSPDPGETCGGCVMGRFADGMDEGRCTLVIGPVARRGRCKYFDPLGVPSGHG